ncbi:DgyrCDS4134 [Dimorphilus gyrociliatus]|uniref:DgyrCDS4134 n=1 Tax=Dimorphilus gyrociliatus TaxID=2664684 RepID=A0A7I8VG18_9ANNE|nr:DgyrCDS4134 [Dimorphilus gyrociliatus]
MLFPLMESARLICYDETVHDYVNIAFRRKISYSGQFESYLYHPTHAIDGFTNSDITLGGCVILKPTNTIKPKLEIELSGYHLVKKLIIWPTNQKANQLLAIYIPDSYNVCADDIQMKNDTETIIYCRNLKLRRYSKVVIQQKLQTDLQLCEIEIYSENIAHKKPVYSSYADYNIQSFVDGNQALSEVTYLGGGNKLTINLLGYYNVYAIDIRPSSLNTFKDFIMELSDINPFSTNQSITYTFCAKKDNTTLTSNLFSAYMCPEGGVKGEFVHFRKYDNLATPFRILEIEIVGKLLKRLSNNETNLLSQKPTWSSSYSQLSSSASTLTDANYLTKFLSKAQDNPWARIDLLGKYKIFQMAILNIGNNLQSRSQNIQGVISEKKDFPITNWSYHSQLCFNNDKHFLRGEYRIWNCKQPLPVGRYAVFFVLGQGQYLNVFEVEAYGEEIVDKHFSLLPIIKADRNSQSAGFSDMISENLYPLKAIDRLSSNFIGAKPYFSCTGSFKENTEGRFTVYLDNNYLIHQIVLLLPLVQKTFNDIQISIENSVMNDHRQFCSRENGTELEHVTYNCSLIGDRVSFYKIGGNEQIQICEVFVFGEGEEYKLDDFVEIVNSTIGYSNNQLELYDNWICSYSTKDHFIQLAVYHKFIAVGFLLNETSDFSDGLRIGTAKSENNMVCVTFFGVIKISKPTKFTFYCENELISKYVRITSTVLALKACYYYILSHGIVNDVKVNYHLEYNKKLIDNVFVYLTKMNMDLLECFNCCMEDDKCESMIYSHALKQCQFGNFEILPQLKSSMTIPTTDFFLIMYKQSSIVANVCHL